MSQPSSPARVVVLASGSGSTFQALLDAAAEPSYPAEVVALITDRPGVRALERAQAAGVPTAVLPLSQAPDRAAWDAALTDLVSTFAPDWVLSAGFLKLTGPAFLARFGGRFLNTHPALLPAFPGMHAPADALDYGVKVAGATLFVVDDGVDTGPVLAQRAVPVLPDDDVPTLHERIKAAEREMLVDTMARIARLGVTVTGRKAVIG